MMPRTGGKWMWCAVTVAWLVSLAGCSEPPIETESDHSAEPQTSLALAQPRTATERIGLGVAGALGDPAVRAWLLNAVARSPYVEHRVPLRRLIVADTSGIVREMVRKAPGFEASRLAELPDLELYFPVPAHLAAARASQPWQVAIRTVADSFLIVRADGSTFRVGETYDPGSTVTVVVGRTEIDYDDVESAVVGGSRTGSVIKARMAREGIRPESRSVLQLPIAVVPHAECDPEIQNCGGGGGGPPPGGDPSLKTYVHYFNILQNMEGILMGTQEVEIFGQVNGYYGGCASATDLFPAIDYVFSITSGHVAAFAIPTGSYRFKLQAYEDDDDRCVKKPGDDPLGNWNTGITFAQYSGAYYTDSPGLAWIHVSANP